MTAANVEVDVIDNDAIDLDSIQDYDKIVLSPGPGLPRNSGRLMEVIKRADSKIPVLGVCLGMQAIAEYLDGELYNQNQVKHGVQEKIELGVSPLFEGLNENIEVGLYHSWAIKQGKGDFQIIATSMHHVPMAIQNEARMFYGVQFHPESIMTPEGKRIIENFLHLDF